MNNQQVNLQEEMELRVLRHLHKTPNLSQRALAKELKISLGSINFCLQALIEKGSIKMQNFKQCNNKMGYMYILTLSGITEKSKLTSLFLKRKIEEYDALQQEIAQLKNEVSQEKYTPDVCNHTHQIAELSS